MPTLGIYVRTVATVRTYIPNVGIFSSKNYTFGAPVKKPNAFYAQSGGVTAVINASACGVIETARKHSAHIHKVYAGRNGIIGAPIIPLRPAYTL